MNLEDKKVLNNKVLEEANIELEMGEKFTQVPENSDYYISNSGRLVSVKRNKVKLIEEPKTADGYTVYTLYKPCKTVNGKKVKGTNEKKPVTAHHLVAEVYCENPYDGTAAVDAHHLDKDRQNNKASNLINVPSKLHKIIDGIREFALFENGQFNTYKNPMEIVHSTGLTLDEILEAVKKNKVYSYTDSKYTIYKIKGHLVGVKFYSEPNKPRQKRAKGKAKRRK